MSLVEIGGYPGRFGRGGHGRIPQKGRQHRKTAAATADQAQVQMPDGRFISADYFAAIHEKARAKIGANARGFANIVEAFDKPHEHKRLHEWMKHLRKRGGYGDLDADTFLCIAVCYTAARWNTTPALLYEEIIRARSVRALLPK